MTTRRTRKPAVSAPAPVTAPEPTIEEILEIAEERETEQTVVEVVKIEVEEPPVKEVVSPPKKAEFVAIPPAPYVPAPVVESEVTFQVKNPRTITRVTRGVRGSNKRG
jgi:hypothetical protein